MGFYYVFKELCEKKGITPTFVVKSLSLSTSKITAWKNGSIPNLEVSAKIADYFNVSTDYLLGRTEKTAPQPQSIAKIGALPRGMSALEAERYKYEYIEYEINEDNDEIIRLPIFSQPVSAGRGNYLSDKSEQETLKFRASEVPDRADFCMRVGGDSMEPRILDGEVIFVEFAPVLDSGEIGVFSLNNDLVCKKLRIDHENRQLFLVSLNPAYKPLEVGEEDTFFTWGRVLGSAPSRRI